MSDLHDPTAAAGILALQGGEDVKKKIRADVSPFLCALNASSTDCNAKRGVPASDECVLQPFCSLAKAGFTLAVAAYILHGLDVHARPDERTMAPMTYIRAMGKKGEPVAHAVRTAINHRSVQKAMQDLIDEAPTPLTASRVR